MVCSAHPLAFEQPISGSSFQAPPLPPLDPSLCSACLVEMTGCPRRPLFGCDDILHTAYISMYYTRLRYMVLYPLIILKSYVLGSTILAWRVLALGFEKPPESVYCTL